MYHSNYDCSYWRTGFIGTNLVRSLLESDKKVLVVEELDKHTKKFENIKDLILKICG